VDPIVVFGQFPGKVGELLDIELLDHIVIGHNGFVSMKERRLGF
jgi:hypothetical protein